MGSWRRSFSALVGGPPYRCDRPVACADNLAVIWDSRTIHHASLPENNNIRTVVYAAYTPRALATPEDLKLKQDCFSRWEGTTHWPHCNIFPQGKAYRNGEICSRERDEPLEKPVLTDKLLRLAGMKAY
jgi:hypothetical protein